ncbi:transposase [Polaromonas sp.]|uniref:transposase n=1 Tax=Polaromonas sp. TaxID=1869339 RepID=UPI0013BDB0AB|nr:hypothetical protein [Polaromonas sp.]
MDDIRSAIQAKGAALMCLPPYSPYYSPIEPSWSKLKMGLRAINPAPATRSMRRWHVARQCGRSCG